MRRRYQIAAGCVMAFLGGQVFQELAYRLWIPEAHTPQENLLVYLLPVDRVRALLIFFTIIPLIVPFTVIALRYRRVSPLASMLAVIFAASFVGFEISHRGLDFFAVGGWAQQFVGASSAEREVILDRFAIWNQIAHGWYFPLMLSYMMASLSAAWATWTDRGLERWYLLAPVAYSLNALRLAGRMLSMFAGFHALDGLNDKMYFPIVVVINSMLVGWFLALGERERKPGDREIGEP